MRSQVKMKKVAKFTLSWDIFRDVTNITKWKAHMYKKIQKCERSVDLRSEGICIISSFCHVLAVKRDMQVSAEKIV